MSNYDRTRLRQIDRLLEPWLPLVGQAAPRKGWLRAIREGLGMSLRQLGERAGVSTTSARSAELHEAKGSIRLDSLRRMAEAMGCELVYAVVPRHGLERLLEEQAEQLARRLVERVHGSMELEDQGTSSGERARQIRALADDLLRERGRGFWDVG